MLSELISFFLHLDVHLNSLLDTYGYLTYLILFLIIFLETGTVITPFLPGDSLIFVAGALAVTGSLNLLLLLFVFSIAAIAGDSLNYWIGKEVGERLFKHDSRFFKKTYLHRTKEFYHKHGAKTIILARFIPIVRTFAPFVAGMGKMNYQKFFRYNVIGGILWVGLFVIGGYLFGNIPFVKEHLSIVIIIVIVISFIPLVEEVIRRSKQH